MSVTYSDLTEANFPDSLDTMTRVSDVSYAYKDLIAQYYAYKNAGNDTAAAQLLAANPVLDSMILNAAKINRFGDIAIALERFFKNDVEGYVEARFAYKDGYNPESTYLKGNIVYFNGEGFICRVESSTGVAPVAHETSDNWAIIAKQGVQGESGTGLAPRGSWNNSTLYYANDCVSYNNILWQCLIENSDSVPSGTNANWMSILTISTNGYVVIDGIAYQSHISVVNGKPQMIFEE